MKFILKAIFSCMYRSESISTDTATLSYRYYRGGDRWLIIFHGFGQTAEQFDALAISLMPQYSILSIDLFFHEASTYTSKGEHPMKKGEWHAILNSILTRHTIHRFSMLGFSMGARFVVSSLDAFSDRIDSIILIAPDGMVINFWYRLATSTLPARKVFRYVVHHPGFFLRCCKLLTRFRIIDDRIVKFAASQMLNEEQRMRVYHSWMYFRKLSVDKQTFIRHVHKNGIDVKMIFGSNDRIVKQPVFADWIEKSGAQVYRLEATHSGIARQLTDKQVLQFLISNGK